MMQETNQEVYGFLEVYFPELTAEPFTDEREQWEAWERFVDMLCMIALLIKEKSQPESFSRIGCLLDDEELIKALEPRPKAVFPCRKDVRDIFQALLQKGQKNASTLTSFLEMELEPVEKAAFLLAACADRNRKYERAFGVLQEEKSITAKPTIGLAHDLCALFLEESENTVDILLDEDRFLNRFLLKPVKDEPRLSRLSLPLTLHRQVLSLLNGNREMLGKLSLCAEILYKNNTSQLLCHQEALARLIRVYTRMTMLQEEGIIQLKGAEGVGKKYLAQALGDTLQMDVLCICVQKLITQNQEAVTEILEEAVRKTVLTPCILYLDMNNIHIEEWGQLSWMLTRLQKDTKRFLIGTDASFLQELSILENIYLLLVASPGLKEQKRFWECFAKEYQIQFSADIQLEELVSLYDLSPKRIRQTLSCAVLASEIGEDGFLLSKQELEDEIRHQCSGSLDRYAVRMESPFVWEDLQLSKQSQALLKRAIDRVRYRSIVNDMYGFAKKLPYGRGLSIVLYGPPGTGKTMTAQVFAKELGLAIYRIDLSQIGSKYIGETEKNLGAVFDAARFSNAVLFFDEADALFTKRTEVSNSNDRHANAETAYLLQKIEEYSGVSILATNVMQNFDNAFKRRMTYMIPIEQPKEEERLLLWENVFPKETPLEDGLPFALYAKVAELTGSGIKAAALSAAYLAAAEHRSITNQDIVEAIDFEYRRSGRTGISQELYTAQYKNM